MGGMWVGCGWDLDGSQNWLCESQNDFSSLPSVDTRPLSRSGMSSL